jgi:hypothetical protein
MEIEKKDRKLHYGNLALRNPEDTNMDRYNAGILKSFQMSGGTQNNGRKIERDGGDNVVAATGP